MGLVVAYRDKDKLLSRVRLRRGDHGDRRMRPREMERDLERGQFVF